VSLALFDEYDILALSETWLTVDSRFALRNFITFRKDSASHFGGGLALAVRSSLTYSYIDNSISFKGRLDSQAISIHFDNYDLTIISIYRYPRGSLSLEEYSALFAFCLSFANVILLGDFNAHHSEWGNERSDNEGELLLSSAVETSFTCINSGSPTFLTRPGQRTSAIDLTFISSSIIGLCDWAVLEDTFLSDHYPTTTLFNRTPTRRSFFSHKIRHSKLQDELFVKNLFSSLDTLRESLSDPLLNPVQKYSCFTEHLLRQWFSNSEEPHSTGRRSSQRGKRFSPPVPWWNDICQQAVSARRALLSTLKRHPSFFNYLAFKKQEAITRRILRTEKSKGWKEFCASLNPNIPISHLWRFIKRFRFRHFEDPITPLSSNLHSSHSVQESINSLCPPSVFHRAFSSIDEFPTNYSRKMFDYPFSFQELISATRNLKTRSSPGFDRIDNRMLSLLPEEYLIILLDVLNSIFDSGSFPSTWQHSLVFLIPKSSPGKLRPISLTSCLLKVLERLILYRLGWWVESSLILPPFQFGFRKRTSCLDNLGILTTKIHHGFISKQSTSCLFLDIQSAFDNVIPSILISQLIDLDLPPKFCWFVYRLTCLRELQFVVNGGLTESFFSHKGVPQGSILSPLLFNLYLSKCGSALTDGCRMVQFADDILYRRSIDIESSLLSLERLAGVLSAFLFERGLTISPSKSALMIFTKKRINPVNYSILLENVSIYPVPSARFLGILLDPKLTGNLHANYVTNKCDKLANIIKFLRGVWWGSHPRTLLSIYKAMIRGTSDYASFLFPFHNKGLTERFERVSRRALRYCVGLRRTTPCNIVYAETCVSPAHFRSDLLAQKFLFKSLATRPNILIDNFQKLHFSHFGSGFSTDLLGKFPLYRAYRCVKDYRAKVAAFTRIPLFLFSYETSTFVPKVDSPPPPQVVKQITSAAFPQLVFLSHFSYLIGDGSTFFTDASKTDLFPHLGAAYFSPDMLIQRKYKLDGCFSVFSAECIAIICAIDCILEKGIKRSSIFTDSRIVVETVSSNSLDRDLSYLIFVLKNKLRSAFLQNLDITLVWVPSHVGILGNEMADFLAGEAAQNGETIDYLPPHTDFYSIAREKYHATVERYLRAQSELRGAQYFGLYPAFAKRPWFDRLNLTRMEITTV